jgi:hypothetical protein
MSNVDEILELLSTPDLSRLEQHLEYKDSLINSFTKQLREHESKLDAVKEYIKQCSSSGDLTDELEHVAKLLDITLVNNYDVTITVTYRGTIEIPMDEDIEDFENHISFEFSAPFSDEWNVDIYQDDIEIEHEEA